MQRKHLRRWPRNDLTEKAIILDIPIQKATLQMLLSDLPIFREMQSRTIERTGQQDKRNRNKEADIMDKRVLEEYIDACEVIKDTEEEIHKLESKKSITANETVSGSNPEFPYNPQHFKVQGTTYSYSDDVRLRAKKEVLKQKKEKAEELKLQVEVWMISIPFRMQRIIKYKIFEDMTWQQVADRMGRKTTETGLKKEFQRFFKKN